MYGNPGPLTNKSNFLCQGGCMGGFLSKGAFVRCLCLGDCSGGLYLKTVMQSF